MRKIKYRAHSKTGPLWVYGYYKYIRCFEQHIIDNENDVYEVCGDTVGQYWRKVNGQELYDGDVFTVNGKYPKLVKWVDDVEIEGHSEYASLGFQYTGIH